MENYLRELQKTEINILKSIHKACEKLNIGYVIISGTLLGAVRHEGFIPWDDDIDIGMTRKDFNKFLKEGQKYLPDNLFIQHYTTEKNDNKIYIKVRDKNTIFIENDTETMDICHGIFVDVFPFDRNKKGIYFEKKEYLERKKFNLLIQCYSKNTISTIINPLKRSIAQIINRTYCRIVPLSKVLKKEEHRRMKLDSKGDDCYLLNQFTWNGTATYEELFERRLYKFGEEQFWGPKQYDTILKKYYGDYMTLPPKEKQVTHKPLKVEFFK